MVQIAVETVSPQLIAAVTSRVRIPEIVTAWEPALYQVKSFLSDRPDLDAGGSHVFLYHHPGRGEDAMEIDFGIEVAGAFERTGNVHCVSTPEGRAATAVHYGALNALPQTHKAIHQWCADNGHAIGAFSWESYVWGDGADPVETVVRYLVR